MSKPETLPDRRAGFRQLDITRALKGAEKAGFNVGRAEIGPDGKIVLVAKDAAIKPESDLDMWLGKNNARST